MKETEKPVENQGKKEKAESKLQQCQQERNDWKDRAMRAAADFANYKKRTEKDQSMWRLQAQTAVLLDILDIVDDFDRAIGEAEHEKKSEDVSSRLAGFELIRAKLNKLLHKYRLQEITQLEIFDPELHEALVHVESKEHKPGQIIEVMQKGYTINGQVLRPAKVSVAK